MIVVDIQTLRQQLVGAIAELPEAALVELVSFVDYLHYKSSQEPVVLPNNLHSQDAAMSAIPSFTIQPEAPLYKRLSPQELAQAFLDWAESHRDLDLPILSDEAISRESIYGERG
jgi:hypothetical protein